jgi:hypothetical protein
VLEVGGVVVGGCGVDGGILGLRRGAEVDDVVAGLERGVGRRGDDSAFGFAAGDVWEGWNRVEAGAEVLHRC